MKKFALFVLLLAAQVAHAGSWNEGKLRVESWSQFTWTGTDSGDQPAIDATQCAAVAITAEVVSGLPSVGVFLVADALTATGSGTSIATITATLRTPPTKVEMGPYFIRPTVTTAGGGGKIFVRCAGYKTAGGGGGPHAPTHAENAADELFVENLGTGCPTGEGAFSNGTGGLVCTPASAPGAHAATHAPGGSDTVLEHAYTPSDNADYNGSDPGNVDDALNYLAARTRFALASNNFDAIADLNTQTLWRRTKPNGPMTATSYAGNPCRAMQEAINYALTVTSPTDTEYSVGWFGEATAEVASDYFDQGPYRGCVFVIPASAA